MKLEVFILGGQKIDQKRKKKLVERLGEMRKGREDRDREREKRKRQKGIEMTI